MHPYTPRRTHAITHARTRTRTRTHVHAQPHNACQTCKTLSPLTRCILACLLRYFFTTNTITITTAKQLEQLQQFRYLHQYLHQYLHLVLQLQQRQQCTAFLQVQHSEHIRHFWTQMDRLQTFASVCKQTCPWHTVHSIAEDPIHCESNSA